MAEEFTVNPATGKLDVIQGVNPLEAVDIELSGASILANSEASGVLTLGGTGGSNNENLTLDFESDADDVVLGTTTNIQRIKFGTLSALLADNNALYFGNSLDSQITWETSGNDNLQLGTTCAGDASGSGYFSLMERADMGNANRSPLDTSANPVLRIYSSDATQPLDYIEMYHDQTNSIIANGSGSIKLNSANDIFLDANGSDIFFLDNGSQALRVHNDVSIAQSVIGLGYLAGRQVIFCDSADALTDFGHDIETNPVVYIHSRDETNINDYISFKHDQTDAVIDVGSGNLNLNASVVVSGDQTFETPGSAINFTEDNIGGVKIAVPYAMAGFSITRSGGTGYSVDDVLTLTAGGGNCTVRVASVVAGVVYTVEITEPGTGYSINYFSSMLPNSPTTGGGGTGCTLQVRSIVLESKVEPSGETNFDNNLKLGGYLQIGSDQQPYITANDGYSTGITAGRVGIGMNKYFDGASGTGISVFAHHNPLVSGNYQGLGIGGYNLVDGNNYGAGSKMVGLAFGNYQYFSPLPNGSVELDYFGMDIFGVNASSAIIAKDVYAARFQSEIKALLTATNRYGVYIKSGNVANVIDLTNDYMFFVETAGGGDNNYQMVLEGSGAGQGIWFNGITGDRLYSDGTNLVVDSGLETQGTRVHNTSRYTSAQTNQASDEIVFADTDGGDWKYTLNNGIEGQHLRITNCGSSGNTLEVGHWSTQKTMGESSQLLSDGETINIYYNATEGWW